MSTQGRVIAYLILLAATAGCTSQNVHESRIGSAPASVDQNSSSLRSDRVQIVVSNTGEATIYIGETAVAIASDLALMPAIARERGIVATANGESDDPNDFVWRIACGEEGAGCDDGRRPLPLPSPTPTPPPSSPICIWEILCLIRQPR